MCFSRPALSKPCGEAVDEVTPGLHHDFKVPLKTGAGVQPATRHRRIPSSSRKRRKPPPAARNIEYFDSEGTSGVCDNGTRRGRKSFQCIILMMEHLRGFRRFEITNARGL